MGDRIENVGKPPCFNGFQVTLNMLKATFWIPAEPLWDSKVCAAPRSKGHFAVAVRCRPVSIRKPPGTEPFPSAQRIPSMSRSRTLRLPQQLETNARDWACSPFNPQYEDFTPRALWSLSNAFTTA